MKKLVLLLLLLPFLSPVVSGQGNIPNGVTSPASAFPKPANTYYYPETSPLYRRTIVPKMPIMDTSKITYRTIVDSADISTQYYDPLGRPYEMIVKQASPSKKDFVSAAVYDEFSRQSTQYLAYVAQSNNNNDGLFKLQPIANDSAFYKGQIPNEQIYYSQTTYDASPLQRVVKTTAPGNSWTGAGVGAGYSWRANNAGDSVRLWTIPISAENDLATTSTVYQPGSLQVQQMTDERGVLSIVYMDAEGRKVLTKTQAVPSPGTGHTGWLCTYYVYDEMDHLRMVLPPKAVAALNNSTINWSLSVDTTINKNLCFSYFYDNRGRVTMKRIPGKGKTYLVYDIYDRPVFAQDSALRNGNQWMSTLYDGQSRPVIIGLLSYASSCAQLQLLVTNQTSGGTTATLVTDSLTTTSLTLSSNPTTGDWRATSSIALASGFGVPNGSTFGATIPSGGSSKNSVQLAGSPLPAGAPFSTLAVMYYDDYNWLNAVGNTSLDNSLMGANINTANFNLTYNTAPDYAQPIVASSRTRGSLTGMKLAVVNSSTYLFTVKVYDDHGRAVQSKQTNYTGGTDIATVQYSFTGRVLRTHVAHQKAGVNAQSHTLLTQYSYDHAGRLLSISNSLDGTATRTVSQNSYNELGQLQQKVFGNSIETQNYTYNMRGWLLGINSNYVGTSGSTSNYFGETLAYDYGFTNSLLNGNIAGVTWKAGGDGVARAYGYSYDSANRLTGANFSQQNTGSSSWTQDLVDYTVSRLSYDVGGNILGMMQKGLVDGKPATVDSLSYQYFTNSNQLQKVSDGSPVTSPLGDFKDSTNTGNDYTYDANGNTTQDLNRHMVSSSGANGAVYNFLNKPDSIVLNGRAGVHYVYDAAGIQLSRQVNDYTSGQVKSKTYQYIGGFVYLNDTLQYVLHEEGQIRNARKVNSSTGAIYYAFEYDYFITDHQGNVRTVLTEGIDTAAYAATMESKDSAVVAATFSNVYSPVYTVQPKPSGFDTDTSNHNVAMLNPASGTQVGPSIVLKVMRGDQVQLSTYSFYNTAVQSPQSGFSLVSSILNVLGSGIIGSSSHLAAGDLTNVNNALNPNVTQFLNNGRSYDNTRPKAYLNWILFDDQFNYVASNSGVAQVLAGSSKQVLAAPTQSISKNGYLYVYVSNESQQNVYFDNLTVKQMTGPLQQEQSYYPFGLPMAGISDKALLKSNTTYKANGGTELEEDYGLEYYNTMFRKYDPQIGRFSGVDAMSESTAGHSPYHFTMNNPVMGTDPSGLLTDIDKEFNDIDAYDNEFGIGGGGGGGGSGGGFYGDGGILSGEALFENTFAQQMMAITPHLSGLFPEAPYIGAGFNGAGTGTDKYGNSVLILRETGYTRADGSDDFPVENLDSYVSPVRTVHLGGSGGGSAGFGGLGGLMFEGGESEEGHSWVGRTATIKTSDKRTLISTILGDKLEYSRYGGKVNGEEGRLFTIDGSTNNKELEGGSVTIGGVLSFGYGTDGTISSGISIAGYQLQGSYGFGVGLGQYGVDFSHTDSQGFIEGWNITARPGLGAAVLAAATYFGAPALPIIGPALGW